MSTACSRLENHPTTGRVCTARRRFSSSITFGCMIFDARIAVSGYVVRRARPSGRAADARRSFLVDERLEKFHERPPLVERKPRQRKRLSRHSSQQLGPEPRAGGCEVKHFHTAVAC